MVKIITRYPVSKAGDFIKGTDLFNKIKTEVVPEVEKVEPNSDLVVFVTGQEERFSSEAQLIANLAELRKFYPFHKLTETPDLIAEYSEVMDLIKSLNAILKKRKKQYYKNRKKDK